MKANAVEVADVDYAMAVETNEASLDARIGRATTCYNLDRMDEVIAESTAALKINPNSPW